MAYRSSTSIDGAVVGGPDGDGRIRQAGLFLLQVEVAGDVGCDEAKPIADRGWVPEEKAGQARISGHRGRDMKPDEEPIALRLQRQVDGWLDDDLMGGERGDPRGEGEHREQAPEAALARDRGDRCRCNERTAGACLDKMP